MSPRRVLAGAAAAWAVASLGGGCGGSDAPSAGDRVEAFVARANAVQQGAAPRLKAADEAYAKFADGKLAGRKAGRELRRVELDLAALRQDLAAVRAPAEASKLRSLLLRSYDMNVLMAAELRATAGYLPRARAALERLAAVRQRLRRTLRLVSGADRQAKALRAYAQEVRAVRDRIGVLEAPPTLVADRDTQKRLLGRARSLALRLAAAIDAQDAPRIETLVAQFQRGGDPQPDLAGVGKGALRAYGQRLQALQQAAAAVTLERNRLAKRHQDDRS